MKRNIHPKAVTVLISGLLVCLLVFWAQAQARKKPTPTPTPPPEKKIRIEDTVERREGDNKITFKPEFELVRQSGNSAVVRKRSAGTTSQPTRIIVGTVVCKCTRNGSGSGGCELTMDGHTATCIASGACSCKLGIVTKVSS